MPPANFSGRGHKAGKYILVEVSTCIYIYTSGQKKGYIIVYHISFDIQEYSLFGICKSYACCYWVGLPTLNQVQWSETSVGRFEGNAWLARYLTFRVLCMSNNWCNGKRIFRNIESSSHFNNKLHVRITIACRIHKKCQRHSSIGKHPLLTFTDNLFVLWCSWCFPIIILHLFTKMDASVI